MATATGATFEKQSEKPVGRYLPVIWKKKTSLFLCIHAHHGDGERGGILLGLDGVRVRAEKETIFSFSFSK